LTGPSPVDRARAGSKHHLLTDSGGIPLTISLTGGHRNDVTQLLPVVDGVGPVRGKLGRPRQRTERLLADRGYDHDKYRRLLWQRGVKPVIARRGDEHGVRTRLATVGRRADLRLAAQPAPAEDPL
jgi:transposase